MGALKVAPASVENTTCTRALSFGAANQATTTVSPSAEIAGPFTGQKSIFQPSAWRFFGSVHAPPTRRTTDMSRIPSSVRSRYTTTGPRDVTAYRLGVNYVIYAMTR